MDINTLRALSTLLLFIALIGMFVWVYSAKRKKGYEEAANLPFVEDDTSEKRGSRHE